MLFVDGTNQPDDYQHSWGDSSKPAFSGYYGAPWRFFRDELLAYLNRVAGGNPEILW